MFRKRTVTGKVHIARRRLARTIHGNRLSQGGGFERWRSHNCEDNDKHKQRHCEDRAIVDSQATLQAKAGLHGQRTPVSTGTATDMTMRQRRCRGARARRLLELGLCLLHQGEKARTRRELQVASRLLVIRVDACSSRKVRDIR